MSRCLSMQAELKTRQEQFHSSNCKIDKDSTQKRICELQNEIALLRQNVGEDVLS